MTDNPLGLLPAGTSWGEKVQPSKALQFGFSLIWIRGPCGHAAARPIRPLAMSWEAPGIRANACIALLEAHARGGNACVRRRQLAPAAPGDQEPTNEVAQAIAS